LPTDRAAPRAARATFCQYDRAFPGSGTGCHWRRDGFADAATNQLDQRCYWGGWQGKNDLSAFGGDAIREISPAAGMPK